MKQYTNESQTAKLIELGFMPEPRIKGVQTRHFKVEIDHDWYFTIGELIKMLPMTITRETWVGYKGVWALQIQTCGTEYSWEVSYVRDNSADLYLEGRGELIDVLYDMCVKLKQEGVI